MGTAAHPARRRGTRWRTDALALLVAAVLCGITAAAAAIASPSSPGSGSGSYKETSSGTDQKNDSDHKHTICHATGSESNPYVVITPSVSAVYHGHIAHQHTEDIIPPFTYKGQTYSQNWDARGQAIFANGCRPPAPPPDDVCPNIAGNQATIPPGLIKDANGNCVTPPQQPPPTDVCPNIDGYQSTVPPGLIKDGAGNCVPPPLDICPNLEGVQSTVPPGMIKDASGNCVTPPGPPPPLIDLAVQKVDTPDPVSVGRELRYSIVVTNRGPVRATGVTMTDTLPGGLRIVSTRASQGSCSAAGATVTCRLGNLAAGASATVRLRAVPSAPGTLLNVARVYGNEPDPRPENNSSSVTTRVVAPFRPPAAVCDSVTVGMRSIVVGKRTTLRVVVKARGRGLAGARVRVTGPGISTAARTNRRGVALVSVRAVRPGIVSIRVAGERCSRRIGAITGSQPDLTG